MRLGPAAGHGQGAASPHLEEGLLAGWEDGLSPALAPGPSWLSQFWSESPGLLKDSKGI